MKSLSWTLLFVLILMSGLSPVMSVQAEFQLMAPVFTLTDVDGHRFSLTDFKGTAVVLTFIATRSIICRVQVNALVNVSRHFEDEVFFILIGVSNNTITIGGDTDDQLRAFDRSIDRSITQHRLIAYAPSLGLDYVLKMDVLSVLFIDVEINMLRSSACL